MMILFSAFLIVFSLFTQIPRLDMNCILFVWWNETEIIMHQHNCISYHCMRKSNQVSYPWNRTDAGLPSPQPNEWGYHLTIWRVGDKSNCKTNRRYKTVCSILTLSTFFHQLMALLASYRRSHLSLQLAKSQDGTAKVIKSHVARLRIPEKCRSERHQSNWPYSYYRVEQLRFWQFSPSMSYHYCMIKRVFPIHPRPQRRSQRVAVMLGTCQTVESV